MTDLSRDAELKQSVAEAFAVSAPVSPGDTPRRSDGDIFRLVFDLAPAGMALVGQDKRLIRVNDKMCRMFGHDRDDLVNMSFEDLTHPDDLPGILELFDAVLSGGEDGYAPEKRCVQKDGAIFHAWVATQCLRLPGRPVRLLVTWIGNAPDKCGTGDGSPKKDALSTGTGRVSLVDCRQPDVTEWGNAQKIVEESVAFSNSIIASSIDCIKVLDTQGRLLFMSECGQKLMEIDDIEPYLNISWFDLWKGKGSQEARRAMAKAVEGRIGTFQGFFPTPRGTPKWWDVIISPIIGKKEYLLAVSRDITDQMAQQAQLRRLAAAIEQVAESVVITDTESKIVYVNPAFEKITGYCRDEVLGKNPRFLQSGAHGPAFYRAMWYRLSRGKIWRGRFVNKRKDGSLLYEDVSIAPVFDSDGKVVNFMAVKRDVTHDVETERRLQQAQKMEAIGTLAGGIAHDFNNILSSVIGYTELALDEVEKGSHLEDNLQEVFTAGKRARDLVKQILTFARQADEEIKPLEVKTIAGEALKLLRASIPATIEIRQRIESESLIMGDPTQVHQVFMNLCTNAAYAMEDQGGVLEVGLIDVAVDSNFITTAENLKPGDYIKLWVSDTGTGISPDIIESIFEPYFTTKAPGEGTGMGLAMVHGIIDSYGGEVLVESGPGRGTVFTVYLPIVKKRDRSRLYRRESLPAGGERILFVDDEPPIAKMGGMILERLGYRVTVRTSSVEALGLFRSRPDDFDLVITDMTMPNKTGDKLAAELMLIRPDIPIILCTGYSKKISDDRAAGIGINAFVYKPVAKADLALTVRKVLDDKLVKNPSSS